jgi:membrane protein DedA with SNARE-associated domain
MMYALYKYLWCTVEIFVVCGDPEGIFIFSDAGTASLIAVSSSTIVIVCAVSSIVFLSIGYACGRYGHKHKQSRTSKAEDDEKSSCHNEGSHVPQTQGPLYEEVLRSTPEHQDLVELKENVAYGPIVK